MTVTGTEQRVYGNVVSSLSYELHFIRKRGVCQYNLIDASNYGWITLGDVTITIPNKYGYNSAPFSKLFLAVGNGTYISDNWRNSPTEYQIQNPFGSGNVDVQVLTYIKSQVEKSITFDGVSANDWAWIKTNSSGFHYHNFNKTAYSACIIDITHLLPSVIEYPYTLTFEIRGVDNILYPTSTNVSCAFIIEYAQNNLSLNDFNTSHPINMSYSSYYGSHSISITENSNMISLGRDYHKTEHITISYDDVIMSAI